MERFFHEENYFSWIDSCNLSRKNETQGKTKPKISGRSANELIISWTIRNQRKTKDTRWRGLEGVSVPWMVLASCSFSRLSKEIENETHGGWWQQKTRTWNLHLLGDYIQMLLQYLSLVIHLGAYNKTKLRFVRKKRDSPERRCLLSICWRVHGYDVLKFLNLQYTYDVPKQHFQEEKYSSWQRSLIGSQRLFFVKFQKLLC